MSQNFFGTLTNPSLPLLDANFTQLYDLREQISTQSYTGSSSKITITSNSELVINGSIPVDASSGRANLTVNGVSESIIVLSLSNVSKSYFYFGNSLGTEIGNRVNADIRFVTNNNLRHVISANGDAYAFNDNANSSGRASNRWSVVYAATGSINTSDAREKTAVTPFTENEILAAKALSIEIGCYRWLTSICEKGAAARIHIGLTVQRAIEIMTEHGLNPTAYGFICHDSWPEIVVPARTEQRDTGLKGPNSEPLYQAVVIDPEKVIPAGDRYSFRPDELLLFIARGFEARLSALEAAIAP